MVTFRSAFFLISMLFVVVLVACQPQQADVQLAALPTLIEFPTETPTPTATNTPTATRTPFPTNTPTLTLTPSDTPTLTLTRLPSLTPSFTPSNTPSNTPTPANTSTPLPTRTPDLPVIEVFQANVSNALPGEDIRLRWSVDADRARFEILDSAGNPVSAADVELIGSTTATAPDDMAAGLYRLIAIRGSEEVRQTISVEIGTGIADCSFNWFNENIPASAGCPVGPVVSTPMLYQRFERGVLFRVQLNGQNRICGLQFDRNLYSCYLQQSFSGQPPTTPAPGFVEPAEALRYTYYTQLGTGGVFYQLIGQAPNSAITTNAAFQIGELGQIFIQLPDAIYSFDSTLTGQGQSFERINP